MLYEVITGFLYPNLAFFKNAHILYKPELMERDNAFPRVVCVRITSYNVCYTKLLRDRFFKSVASSPVFDPVREVWGEGFSALVRDMGRSYKGAKP